MSPALTAGIPDVATARAAARALVVAKAPVPGEVKTRLALGVGGQAAADLAAAALLDTVETCASAFGARRCVLAISGDLASAARGDECVAAVAGWTIVAQRGQGLAERLAHAHEDAGAGPVVQVGMDTPQVTADDLRRAAAALDDHDAVLGPAEDGGWWVLAVRAASSASALREVEMSTTTTYADTRSALTGRGLRVAVTRVLRDVDTVRDASAIAAASPRTRFADAWREVCRARSDR